MLLKDSHLLVDRLSKDGFAFIPSWRTNANTHEIAESIGNVIDTSLYSNGFSFQTVQTLQPRHKQSESRKVYSDIFGLSRFPLHTDLAYWYEPPHYLILRCLHGSSEVSTRILSVDIVEQIVGESLIKRALVKPRHLPHNTPVCILPLRLPGIGKNSIRWDSVFLHPVNETASQFSIAMASVDNDSTLGVDVALVNHGDTLIIDNWRVLHGRSSVPCCSEMRRLERIYLSALH